MFCPKCGKDIHDNSEYCIECGIKIEDFQKQGAEHNNGSLSTVLIIGAIIVVLYLAFAGLKPFISKYINLPMSKGKYVQMVKSVKFPGHLNNVERGLSLAVGIEGEIKWKVSNTKKKNIKAVEATLIRPKTKNMVVRYLLNTSTGVVNLDSVKIGNLDKTRAAIMSFDTLVALWQINDYESFFDDKKKNRGRKKTLPKRQKKTTKANIIFPDGPPGVEIIDSKHEKIKIDGTEYIFYAIIYNENQNGFMEVFRSKYSDEELDWEKIYKWKITFYDDPIELYSTCEIYFSHNEYSKEIQFSYSDGRKYSEDDYKVTLYLLYNYQDETFEEGWVD